MSPCLTVYVRWSLINGLAPELCSHSITVFIIPTEHRTYQEITLAAVRCLLEAVEDNYNSFLRIALGLNQSHSNVEQCVLCLYIHVRGSIHGSTLV